MLIDSDRRPLHRSALDDVTALLASPPDLTLPTPCAGWDLAALLGHMVGQNHGFAAAVTTPGTPADAYAPRAPRDWAASADELAAALAAAPTDRDVLLAELGPQPIPFPTVVGIHLLDTVVHAWDVATALGVAYRPDDEVLRAVAAVSRMVPDGGREPAFGPVATPADPDDEWSRILAHLGR